MSFTLHHHPLASFCWKAAIALHEANVPFTSVIVDLGSPESRAAFERLWPLAKMPVLVDEERGLVLPEATIIVEHLAERVPSARALVPADPDLAREARLRDRILDSYVHQPMQKIVVDRIRPAGAQDPHGVAEARETLRTAYAWLEADLAEKTWAAGETFTLADCAAAPALFYARLNEPFGADQVKLAAYLARLRERPSFARVIEEARPWFQYYPSGDGARPD